MGSSMYPGGKGASVMLGCRSREQLAGRGEGREEDRALGLVI